MYLSRIQLDPGRRSTMKALASPTLFHGAIEQSFSGPRSRNLWRIDMLGDKLYLIVMSRNYPDFGSVALQFGPAVTDTGWETRDYESFLSRLKVNDTWHFRLTANPTVSRCTKQNERGKVLGHITPEYQKQWLLARAATHGFVLNEEDFSITESRWLRFRKGSDNNRNVTILSVTFEGVLTISDSDLFRQTLRNGIGRGKAYGNGLLTVAGKHDRI